MIDEKALIEIYKEKVHEESKQKGVVTYEGDIHSSGFVSGVLWAIEIAKAQPTACDPDKVVEKLEDLQNFEERTGKSYCPDGAAECRYKYSDLGCTHCAFEKAIETVKGGVE